MLLSLLACALAAASLQERRLPEFRSDVRMIRLDVSVVDRRGLPVAGLGPDDFLVREDGRPVELTFFEPVEPGGGPQPEPEPRAGAEEPEDETDPPSRRLLLLVDTAGMTPGQLMRARSSVGTYLREGTHVDDWVRLVNLSTGAAWDGRIPRDRFRLEAAARSLAPRGSPWTVGGADPEVPSIDERVELEPGGGAVSAAETSGRFLSVFARASDLLGSLEALLVELAGVVGRKGVVLVSPGFPQLRNLDHRLERVASLARAAATAVYFVDAAALDGLLPERGPLRPVFELVWARSGGAQDLAEATGGFTSRLTNSLTPALSRIAGEMRTYYVVGYVPTRTLDGRFRSVEVRVRVPGLKARTKKGYLAAP